MRTKALLLGICGVLGCIVCVGYLVLRHAEQKAAATREASKMMELRTRHAPELENFYQTHGAYPQRLQDLPLENFNWGAEGATPKDLESFSYATDGQAFVMRWNGEGRYGVYLGGSKGVSQDSEHEAASKPGK